MAQWIRICLPMQETRFRSLIGENPTCCRAAKRMDYNYGASALEQGIYCNYWNLRALLVAQLVKNLPAMRETGVQSLGWEDPLEKGMTILSSTLA